jgi:hypothetical protein
MASTTLFSPPSATQPTEWTTTEIYLEAQMNECYDPFPTALAKFKMPPRLIRGVDPDPTIFTSILRYGFRFESHWVQIDPTTDLTPCELQRVRFGGRCEVCRRGDNWRRHRGAVTAIECLLEVYCPCRRFDRAELRRLSHLRYLTQ